MAISKKAMAAAGTGAMGAAGATALALGLGAFGGDGEITAGKSFKNSSAGDEFAIDSKNLKWEAELMNNSWELNIKAMENESIRWQCRLRPIVFESISGKENFSTLDQGKELLEQIKNDENRKRFIENCSKFRGNGEKLKGLESGMDLNAEKDSEGKFKFKDFEKLWTEENFRGEGRINESEAVFFALSEDDAWSIKEEGKKITITGKSEASGAEFFCSISGNPSEELASKKFKDGELKRILKLGDSSNEVEKKGYLIKNCVGNNWEIKGLEIQTDNSGKWEFKNFEETLLRKLYTNPK